MRADRFLKVLKNACQSSLRDAPTLLVALTFSLAACANVGTTGITGTTDASGDTGAKDGTGGDTGKDSITGVCAGISCDDGDPCTDDLCDDATKTCKHVANAVCKDTVGGDSAGSDTGETPDGPNLKAGDLVITEILYNPFGAGKVSDTIGEWFEIYNPGASDIDLGGIVVRDAGKDKFVVPAGNVIKAQGYFVLGISADTTVNGGVSVQYAYGKAMTLNNTFDAVIIESNGQLIDAVSYDITKSWLNLNGVTLSLSPTGTDATGNDNPATWCGANTLMTDGDRGTPGALNDACQTDGDKDGIADAVDNCPNVSNPGQLDSNTNGIGDACEAAGQKCGDGNQDPGEACDDGGTISGDGCSGFCQIEVPLSEGAVIITEFMADPKTVSDALGEWFEVYNPGTQDVLLNGVVLSASPTTTTFVVEAPGPVVVPAGGFAVLGPNADVTTNGGVKVDYQYHKLSLANTAGAITLKSAGTVVDTIVYDKTWPVVAGKSLALDPTFLTTTGNDVATNWCKGQAPFASGADLGSPGAANPPCAGANQDEDGDGVPDGKDNCKSDKNADQADGDADGAGDVCDNCKVVPNPDQADGNKNGVGDACEVAGCGNGVPEAGEQCDDGNVQPGDGCSATCTLEADIIAGSLVISEVMANPKAVGDTAGEWIEIYNPGSVELEMAGLTLQVNAATHVIKPVGSLKIGPGAYVVLGRSLDPAVNGGANVDYVYPSSISLPNSAEFAVRIISNAKTVDEVLFNPSSIGWQPLGNGNSFQLSADKLDVVANDSGPNWCWGVATYGAGDFGTPGAANLVCGADLDTDKDGVADGKDNCPLVANVDQVDTDADAIGDACDACPNAPAPGTVDGCVSLCGNATLDTGEECDDGNQKNGDGCNSKCLIEVPSSDPFFTEIMVNSMSGSGDTGEYVEIHNPSNATVNLTNWVFAYKTVKHTMLAQNGKVTIDPGGYLVLGHSKDATANNGAKVDYVFPTALSNTSGSFSLTRDDGTLVDTVNYATAAPWPVGKQGYSVQLSTATWSATANDAGANWCTSTAGYGTAGKFGTPGSDNKDCALPGPKPQPIGTGSLPGAYGYLPPSWQAWFVPSAK